MCDGMINLLRGARLAFINFRVLHCIMVWWLFWGRSTCWRSGFFLKGTKEGF